MPLFYAGYSNYVITQHTDVCVLLKSNHSTDETSRGVLKVLRIGR